MAKGAAYNNIFGLGRYKLMKAKAYQVINGQPFLTVNVVPRAKRATVSPPDSPITRRA